MKHLVSWFAGIDLGDKMHQVHLTDADGKACGSATFPHGGKGVAQLLSWLVKRAGGAPEAIGVAMEAPHGAVVEGLLDRGFVVCAINPKQANRARDLYVLSGAKDDRRDAQVLAAVLRGAPHLFRYLQPKHPVLLRLRDRSRLRSDLVKRRTQLSQKIRSQLLRYFPEMWEVAEDLSGLWGTFFLTLWERAPTPAKARRLRRATLAKLLKQCRIRRLTGEDLRALFHQPALVVAPGVTEGAVEAIGMLVEQLQVVNRQVKTMDQRIEELLAELPAVLAEAGDGEAERPDALAQLRSMAGAGPIVAAGLFGEASDLLIRGSFEQARAYLGAAPVTKQSGGSRKVHRRRAVNRHGQNALYHFATAAIAADKGVQQQKEQLKARGLKYARILRTIGDRRLRVFFAMRRDGTLYDPEQTLRKTAAA